MEESLPKVQHTRRDVFFLESFREPLPTNGLRRRVQGLELLRVGLRMRV